jgi:hypothetical protein
VLVGSLVGTRRLTDVEQSSGGTARRGSSQRLEPPVWVAA